MKKVLYGVMMLLVVSMVFIGCKKSSNDDNNGGNGGEETTEVSFNLSKESLIMQVGDVERLIAATTNSTTANFVWESSDESVATVTTTTNTAAAISYANVKAVGNGTANIICRAGASMQVCEVTVTSELGKQNFDKAIFNYTLDETTNKPLEEDLMNGGKKYPDLFLNATGDTIWCQHIRGTMLWMSNIYYDNTGFLAGSNVGYMAVVPCYLIYTDKDLNPDFADLFLDEETQEYYPIVFRTGWYATTEDTDESLGMEQGKVVNEAEYITHVSQAMVAFNGQDYSTMWNELYAGYDVAYTGGLVYRYALDQSGEYANYGPCALVDYAVAKVDYAQADYKYMNVVSEYAMRLKPIGGTDLFELVGDDTFQLPLGVETEVDEQGNVVVTGTEIVFGNNVTFDNIVSFSAPRGNRGMYGVDAQSLKQMKAMPAIAPAKILNRVSFNK
ncbi:MAG: hypothetical protein IJS00_06175 [Paludibacteraceae bacterium]|nr:hypothetical protein [Paludibacteraceae bacterium]